MSRQSTVAVCGSCTSRDNFSSRFNPGYGRWFRVSAEVFQTSVIALMSPALAESEIGELVEAEQSYQVRIARDDATRSFLDALAEAEPDFLVLDFFADVYFGALRLPDGRYLTNNRWMLWKTALHARLKAAGGLTPLRIAQDPDAYLALWCDALDRFAAFVAEHCPDTQVVVHRGLYVDEAVVGDDPRPVPVRSLRKLVPTKVARANRLWARLDDYALETHGPTHGWTAIDLRAEGWTSYAEHPWKPFWVHYTPDYYHRFLAEMLTLDLARHLAPADAARVRALGDSAHERAVEQEERWASVRAGNERRIRELEGLGRIAAVKFAIGQRIRKTRDRPNDRPTQEESR